MNAHAPIILGNRQEQFCQQILSGKSVTEAYRIAYGAKDKTASEAGSRLSRNIKVVARLEQLKAHEAAARRITLPFLTRELLDTAWEARAIGQHGAASSCYTTIGKMHGLLTDKLQVDVAIRKPSASPDSPDDMTESAWLESAGLVIEHLAQSVDQPIDHLNRSVDSIDDLTDQSIEDISPIDQATSVDQVISTPGLNPESGGQPERVPGAKRSHPVDETPPGEIASGSPPPPLEVEEDTLYTKEPESQTTMPMKSQKQRSAMHAAAEGRSKAGIPKSVAKKFVRDDTGGKHRLPKKAKARKS